MCLLFLLLQLACPLVALSFQLPFSLPFLPKAPPAPYHELPPSPPRVAIVGAGAAGSSAAFWLSKAQQRFGLDVHVDIYDSNPYIGGRTTVAFPYADAAIPPIELGSSAFRSSDRVLARASTEFNLTRNSPSPASEHAFGLWDGSDLIFQVTNSWWWDTPILFWRYGLFSQSRTDDAVKSLVKSIDRLYEPDPPTWDDFASLAKALNYTDALSQTTYDYLKSKGVSIKYIHEAVEAAIRANSAQSVDTLHALSGLFSLAATNTVSIQSGNYQIFENFIRASAANLYLNTTVIKIEPSKTTAQSWDVHHQSKGAATSFFGSSSNTTTYKAVILAFPIAASSSPSILRGVQDLDFAPPKLAKLHVTVLTTTSTTINGTFLSRKSITGTAATGASKATQRLPRNVYTTPATNGTELEFNSIQYLHQIVRDGHPTEWIVKILSPRPLNDEWLKGAFDNQVGWVEKRTWDAYPGTPADRSPPVKLRTGLYYVNAYESFLSTTEMATLASRNVVDLMLNEEFGGAGVCRGGPGHVTLSNDSSAQILLGLETNGTQDSGELTSSDVETTAAVSDADGSKGFVFGFDC